MKKIFELSFTAAATLGCFHTASLAMNPPDPNEFAHSTSKIKKEIFLDALEAQGDCEGKTALIPQHSTSLKPEDYNNNANNYSVLYNGSQPNKEVLQLLLFYRGIDPKTTTNTALVCKEWQDLITKGKAWLSEALKQPNADLKFLERFFVHPSVFVFATQVLESDFPYQNMYTKFFKKFEKPDDQIINQLMEGQVDNQIPKIFENYVSLIHACPKFYPFLADYFSQLDPLDYKIVALSAYIIKNSPSLHQYLEKIAEEEGMFVQKYLEKVEYEESVDTDSFGMLLRDKRSHPNLRQHLMALKLLTLSDDPSAKEKLDTFEDSLHEDLRDSHRSLTETLAHKMEVPPFLLHQPFWSTYMVNTGQNNTLWPQFQSLWHLTNSSNQGQRLNFKQVEQFCKYVLAIAPYVGSLSKLLESMKNLAFLSGKDSVSLCSLQRSVIDNNYKTYKTLNIKNFPHFAAIMSEYFDCGQFAQSMEILREALANTENSTERLDIERLMTAFILTSGDEANFSLATQYIEESKAEFNKLKNELAGMRGLPELECALNIFKEEFEEACNLLIESGCPYLESSPALMKALQVQHLKMPHKLKALFKEGIIIFKDRLTNVSMNKGPLSDKFLLENEDLFLYLLEEYPLEKIEFEKITQEIRQEYRHSPSYIERKK